MFSAVDRDPRERVVTVVFMALVRPEDYQLVAGDDASNALWFDERYLPPLAFDHAEIIREAHVYLEEMLRLKPIAFELLNKAFSLGELQKVYEVINRTTYDRRNFQRKVMQSGLLSKVEVSENRDWFESDICFSTAPTQSMSPSMKRPGRKPSKLFTFKEKTPDSDSESEQSAIRDIFDY